MFGKKITNIILILSMIILSRSEEQTEVNEIMNQSRSKPANSKSTIIDRIQSKMTYVSTLISEMFAKALEDMQTSYQQEVRDAQKANDGFWDKVGDFFSGGANSKQVLKKTIAAADEFESSVKSLLEGLLKVLGGVGGVDVSDKLKTAVVQGENGYLTINPQAIVDARKLIIGLQNVEMLLSELSLTNSEEAAAVRGIVFGVSSPSNRAFVSQILEIRTTHLSQIFDQSVDLMMKQVQLFNQRNYLNKQLEKLEIAQAGNIIAAAFTVIAEVLMKSGKVP